MSNLTTEARERRVGLQQMLKTVLAVQTALSALERLLRRLIARKRDLPTMDDLAKVLAGISKVDSALDVVTKMVATLREIFQF